MASSYTGLGTELMTTGENAGTWGSTTNTNLQIIEQISGGYTTQDIAGSADTTTLSVSDGSTGAVLAHRVIEFTGTITGNQIVTIPLDVQQLYVIKNGTSGAYTVQFKYASGSGSSVTWGTSDKGTKLIYATANHATNPDLVDSNIGGVGAVDLNGATLTLDADGDTDITADTDDQIDIRIAGADDFQFTANTFTAQSGSTIAAQALTATTITASGIVKTDDTTEATSTTDGSLQTDGGLSVAKDAVFGDDVKLLSDSAVLSFGADSDTTLTHTDGTGLTLNSANKLLFRDSALSISSSTDGQLDIDADTEVEIATTTVDLNGALDVSGASQFSGAITTGVDDTGVDVKFFGATSGSFLLWDESDDALELTDSSPIKIGDGGDMQVYHDGSNSYITNSTGALKLATETSGIAVTIGHTTSETTIADNATITGNLSVGGNFDVTGTLDFSDSDITNIGSIALDTITNDGTDITLDSSGDIVLDAGGADIILKDDGTTFGSLVNNSGNLLIKSGSSPTTTMTIDGSQKVTFAGDIVVADDIFMSSDDAKLQLGTHQDVTITHDPDDGLILKSTATADDNPFLLTIQTGETDIAVDDVLGTINFQAPDEGAGTDAILVAAGIEAVSEGDFSSSNNATKLSFKTGASEAATEKVAISSAGNLNLTASNTELRFYEGSNYVGFEAPALSADQIWVLPSADGSADQMLKTDGSGNLGWATTSSAADDISTGDAAVTIATSSGNITIDATANDSDIIFKGTDNSSDITMLTLDGSEAGAATFNNKVVATELDISGNVDIDGTLETDAITLDGTSFIKLAGTNFTGSLLLGHATTGTLDAAQYNTGVGLTALDAITNGDNNTAVGYGALTASTSGARNTAIGVNAMTALTSGIQNVAIGHGALDNTNSSYNVAVGTDALTDTTGANNTAVGYRAGYEVYAGAYNITVGYLAGDNITSGSGNVVIGKADVASATGDDQLKISDGEDGSVAWITGDSSGNLTFPADVTLGDDLVLDSDSAVLKFGDDQDVTLTHTDGTGLTLNSTSKLCFQDTGTHIYSNADGDLDVVSDGTAIDSINLESAGGITLDAGSTTHGITYEDDGTAMLQITNSSSDVIIKPLVDAKDIIFQQYDGTAVLTIEDNATANIPAGKLAIGGTAVTSTAAELNLLDGGTSVGSSITLADADGIVVNDGGTMKTIPASDLKTYNPGGTSWQSVITGATTMVSGRGYFVNTTSSAFTMTLPASPSIGDSVTIIDYAGTFDSNNCTVGRNSEKIHGASEDLTVATERAAFTLVYTDSTQGWLLTNN